MAVLDNIQPKEVFRFFEELCQIPHGTFNTKRISDYCVRFAEERGLACTQDKVNNVIIRKPGTKGYEDSEPVILQGHMDMVCEKRPGSGHDFSKDPLKLVVKDGYVMAEDTTLGGDDGIAIAMAMAILDSKDIPHPPIEAVFTVDEEQGMEGAIAIDLSGLKGRKLLNIDSEAEGILTTGCAGGFLCETAIPLIKERHDGAVAQVKVHGLRGGHSGAEIHQQRGNAHKMMGRLLNEMKEEFPLFLISIDGGSKDNVIAMECTAQLLVTKDAVDKVSEKAKEMKAVWDHEFMGDEPGLAVDVSMIETEKTMDVCDRQTTDRAISYLVICPNGVQGLARKLPGLVETSLNIGVIKTEEDSIKINALVRSSVESQKEMMKRQMQCCAELAGARIEISGEYPAWQYDPDSELRKVMEEAFQELYGKNPVVSAIHAGLECGLFLGKSPDLDCVSFGPDLLDIHSFNERLGIDSTERTWNFLKAVLAKLK